MPILAGSGDILALWHLYADTDLILVKSADSSRESSRRFLIAIMSPDYSPPL